MGPGGSVQCHWLQVRKAQRIKTKAVKLAPQVYKCGG